MPAHGGSGPSADLKPRYRIRCAWHRSVHGGFRQGADRGRGRHVVRALLPALPSLSSAPVLAASPALLRRSRIGGLAAPAGLLTPREWTLGRSTPFRRKATCPEPTHLLCGLSAWPLATCPSPGAGCQTTKDRPVPEPAGAAQTSQSEGRSRRLACLRLRTGSGAAPGPASSRLSPVDRE